MQNSYHQYLKFPFEFTVTETNNHNLVSFYDERLPALVQLLDSVNIAIRHGQRFYIQPGDTLPAHIDCDHINNYAKLNFVFRGQGSVMKWFRLKSGTELKSKLTGANTHYLYAAAEDLIEEYSCAVGFPSLVNSGQCHSVVNGSTEPRICYSFMLTYKEDPTRNIEWNDAVARLKSYIVDQI
jgi:hypothetical protein